MGKLFNKLEKLILFLFLTCFILLLVCQFINYKNDYGVHTYNFENNNKLLPFNNNGIKSKGIVVLKNMTPSYDNVGILLNGKPVGYFGEDDELEIHVYHNDLIEIDGTKHNNRLKVKVVGISNNVETPKLDATAITSQSIEILSKVKLK
ncbi:hypothetical protein [Clostridium sp. Cult3]|uniref:hypothetical protein n=1 Tax=Clostridium sp. Cult3 TaxID=2079004 RepID=UPI001F2EE2DF|nr:hypothetical protein [Clostridium sp. Cult3]MCF6459734.1 hypothetical protein [Clostridium sp. Cult3]